MSVHSERRKLHESESLKFFSQSLDTLEALSFVYDQGRPEVCLLMATEIYKVLVENSAAQKQRKNVMFSGPIGRQDKKTLSQFNSLIFARIDNSIPKLSYIPKFHSEEYSCNDNIIFKQWWNRIVIYRASAAKNDAPDGAIPLYPIDQVPFNDRLTLTRRTLITTVRNSIGAHQSDFIPKIVEDLEKDMQFGGFVVRRGEAEYSTFDGSLEVRPRALAAMIRQICHEVLKAYSRLDGSASVSETFQKFD